MVSPDGFAALTAGDPDGSGRIIRNAAHLYVAQRSGQVQSTKTGSTPGAILSPSDGEAD
jgi:hypothetical protein